MLGYIDCSSWYTVESSSTCSSCGPEPSGASASTFADTSRSSGVGGTSAPPASGAGGSAAGAPLCTKHDVRRAHTSVHVSCENEAPVAFTRCNRHSAATWASAASCGCWRERTTAPMSSSKSGDSSSYAPE